MKNFECRAYNGGLPHHYVEYWVNAIDEDDAYDKFLDRVNPNTLIKTHAIKVCSQGKVLKSLIVNEYLADLRMDKKYD